MYSMLERSTQVISDVEIARSAGSAVHTLAGTSVGSSKYIQWGFTVPLVRECEKQLPSSDNMPAQLVRLLQY